MLLKLFAALGILAALVGFATAEDHAVIIDDSKPGTFLMTVDANGGVTVVPLRVTRVGKPSPPVDPPSDPTAFEAAITKLAQAAITSGGTKTTGAALASVYSLVSSGVSDGSVSPDKAFEAVKKATDTVLSIQSDGPKWATFRTEVGKALTALAADGSLTTKAQIVGALQSIANGMNKATGFTGKPAAFAKQDPTTAGILDGIDIAKLIELIKLVMELIKLFGG
jgi:hypothetical protein